MTSGAQSVNRLSPLWVTGMAFVLYALGSVSVSSGDWLWASAMLWGMVGCFVLGCVLPANRVWFVAAVAGVILIGVQFFYPLGPNYFGSALAVTLAGAIAYRIWWYIPFALGGLVYSQSRGALLAAGVACLIGLWRWDRFWAMTLGLIAVLLIISQKPDGAVSLASRLGIWQDTINHLTPLGHGYGSFQTLYASFPIRTNMPLQLAPHTYNDFLELISDLGIGAVFLWTFIILAWERTNYQAKFILVTFFMLSLTHFPLYVPVLCNLFAFTLGDLTSQRKSQWHDGN